jgi:uncharacterized membrane protein
MPPAPAIRYYDGQPAEHSEGYGSTDRAHRIARAGVDRSERSYREGGG